MRVVHLLRKYNPAEWGGTETAIQRLLEGLRAQGVTSVVYCPRLETACAERDPLVEAGYQVERFRAFVPVLGISRERKRQLVSVGGNLMSFGLIPALWREKHISVIHTHTLGRIGGIARALARRRRIPLVITIHGGVLDLPDQMRKAFNSPVRGGWEWGRLFGLLLQSHRVLSDADAILTCNPREAALWRERFPSKRIVVQPHGVPLAAYRQDHRAAAGAAFPQLRDRQVLLSLGRIDPIKNQAWLLEQAPVFLQRHPRLLVVLAGPCTDEAYGEAIRRRIQEQGLGERVVLTGGLPPGDPRLLGLLQEAVALVLPSVSETFGLVILEAWAAGTMVLSSRTSGASALVAHGENGWLFDLDQPHTFHKALDRTLAEPELARQMVARGTAVSAKHSLEAVAGQMKRLYEQLSAEVTCAT
jgi:alpha-maltose-1-phosphate synthase